MEAIAKLFKIEMPYQRGGYSKIKGEEQWIRISDGCPHQCPYCYCPPDLQLYDIPKIVRNHVEIMDMNLLAQPKAIQILTELSEKRADNKVIYYELICGIDYRFLTQEIADLLHGARFKNIRIAWDSTMRLQKDIKQAVRYLTNAKYRPREIMIFMICNWKISYKECCRKLDLLKVWNCKVADSYFDGQTTRKIEPIYWTVEEIQKFRAKCRKHNQLIRFGIDPLV